MQRVDIAPCCERDCYGGLCNDGQRDQMKEKRIHIVSKYAHHIFAVNPDLLYFLPENITSFLPYSVSNWYDIQDVPFKIDRRIEIVHSATDRGAKGSNYIMHALKNLKKKYNLEISFVENMPNQKALEIYRQADLIVDQVLSGWYGGFAVEAMKMGKPVGVFIREEDLKFIPDEMAKDLKEAVINLHPHHIESILREYLENPQWLYQKGKAGLEYVHKWHDPVYVASITKQIYER